MLSLISLGFQSSRAALSYNQFLKVNPSLSLQQYKIFEFVNLYVDLYKDLSICVCSFAYVLTKYQFISMANLIHQI